MLINAKALVTLLDLARPLMDKRSVRIRLDGHLSIFTHKDGVLGEVRSRKTVAGEVFDQTITVPHAQGFADLVRTYPPDTQVDLRAEAHTVTASVGDASFSFPIQEEVPRAPVNGHGWKDPKLAAALRQVLPAAADTPQHGALCGVRFESGAIIGCNGARIHRVKSAHGFTPVTVPVAWAKIISGLDLEGEVGRDGDNRVHYSAHVAGVGDDPGTDVHVVGNVLEGAYPDTSKYGRQSPGLVLNRSRFLASIQALVAMGREIEVEASIVSGQLGLRSEVGALLVPTVRIEGDVHGETMRLDARLLESTLSVLSSAEVRFGFGTEVAGTPSPVSIEPIDESGFLGIIARRVERK